MSICKLLCLQKLIKPNELAQDIIDIRLPKSHIKKANKYERFHLVLYGHVWHYCKNFEIHVISKSLTGSNNDMISSDQWWWISVIFHVIFKFNSCSNYLIVLVYVLSCTFVSIKSLSSSSDGPLDAALMLQIVSRVIYQLKNIKLRFSM